MYSSTKSLKTGVECASMKVIPKQNIICEDQMNIFVSLARPREDCERIDGRSFVTCRA